MPEADSKGAGLVGIVTVTYNSAPVLDGFLKSLTSQSETAFLLFAIDNASSDSSTAILRAWGDRRLRLIPNRGNLGVAAGNNQGICAAMEAGCDYVLLLNNDTEFGPNLLRRLRDQVRSQRGAIGVPKMFYFDRPNVIWCAGGAFQRWQALGARHYGEGAVDRGQFDRVRQVGYAPTCCMLIRREVFAELGLMDEKYFVYYDDTDFCLRARRHGIPIWYCPAATLWHKVSSLTGASSTFMLRYCTRNKVYFIRKHFPWPKCSLWLAAYQALFLLRYLAGRDTLSTYVLKRAAYREGLVL